VTDDGKGLAEARRRDGVLADGTARRVQALTAVSADLIRLGPSDRAILSGRMPARWWLSRGERWRNDAAAARVMLVDDPQSCAWGFGLLKGDRLKVVAEATAVRRRCAASRRDA
jgi:hypothetical protein